MMQFTTPCTRFHITSHGNGWAYEVTDRATGDSLWFQDQDAAQLREETEDFTNSMVLDMYFEMIGD